MTPTDPAAPSGPRVDVAGCVLALIACAAAITAFAFVGGCRAAPVPAARPKAAPAGNRLAAPQRAGVGAATSSDNDNDNDDDDDDNPPPIGDAETVFVRPPMPAFFRTKRPVDPGVLDRLLKELGADVYVVRRKAYDALAGFGPDAIPAVRRALAEAAGRDPETAASCRRLMRRHYEELYERHPDGRAKPLPGIFGLAGKLHNDPKRIIPDAGDEKAAATIRFGLPFPVGFADFARAVRPRAFPTDTDGTEREDPQTLLLMHGWFLRADARHRTPANLQGGLTDYNAGGSLAAREATELLCRDLLDRDVSPAWIHRLLQDMSCRNCYYASRPPSRRLLLDFKIVKADD